MSTYYHVCPYCGCNIDPGERCDCRAGAEETDDAEKRQKTAESGKEATAA